MRDDPEPTANAPPSAEQCLWLLGQPQLADYLSFVRENAVGGTRLCPRALTDEWRAANDRYYELEQGEAGCADTIECLPLGPALAPLVAELQTHPHYFNTFDSLPMSVEMVELDKLIVSQTHVTSSFAEARARKLGKKPDPAALFRFCQPLQRDLPAVRVEQAGDNRWIFSSPSTDLRPHEAVLLGASGDSGVESTGPIAGLVGFPVGFGANFLTAIRSDRRLVLHNGYHRAYALRALGITHAPCLIETVTRTDELRVAATEKVSSDPAFYFRAARPPLLKDFFDRALTRRFALRPHRTVVELEYSVKKTRFVEPDPDDASPAQERQDRAAKSRHRL